MRRKGSHSLPGLENLGSKNSAKDVVEGLKGCKQKRRKLERKTAFTKKDSPGGGGGVVNTWEKS